MRRLSFGLVVVVATAMVPTWAMAGNQEVAEQIAANLRDSGQLRGYRIGVKYQDGTAWLRGQVNSREQMAAALAVVNQTPGVTQVVNNLTVNEPTSAGLVQTQAATSVEQASVPQLAVPAGQTAEQQASLITPIRAEPKPAARMEAAPMPPTPVAVPTSQSLGMRKPQPIPVAFTKSQVAAPEAVPPAPVAEGGAVGMPMPQYVAPSGMGMTPARYDQPNLPNYAWPAYAAHPNYAAVTYPKQYSPTAWPYIGPFYPYPQVPLGWRKVSLEWHDGWWNLDFDDGSYKGPISGLFRPLRHH